MKQQSRVSLNQLVVLAAFLTGTLVFANEPMPAPVKSLRDVPQAKAEVRRAKRAQSSGQRVETELKDDRSPVEVEAVPVSPNVVPGPQSGRVGAENEPSVGVGLKFRRKSR